MSIENTVIKLLHRYDCVIVPGFGGFVAKQKSAVFHPVTYRFDPPRKVAGFNSDLTHTDGLLASEIGKTENLSYEEAAEKIQADVDRWKNQLQQRQTVFLSGLGSFKNNGGILNFIPDENQNFDINSYGLSQVKGQYMLRDQKTEEIQTVRHTTNWSSYAVAVVFAFLVGLSGFFANNELVQPQLSSVFPLLNSETNSEENESSPIAPVINLSDIENRVTENSSYESPETQNNSLLSLHTSTTQLHARELLAEDENEEVDLSVKKFQVIGGSFKVYSQAMEHQAKLKREGYERAIIIGKVGNYFMVAFDTFHDINQAVELKRKLEKKGLDVFVRP